MIDGVIIVTGSTQGLGKGIAKHLADQGAEGLVVCGRNRERGQQVADEISADGCDALFVETDLTHEMACRNVVRSCERHFGRVHALVNCAASTARGTLNDTTVELWDYIFALNVRAPFILTQECVRLMKRDSVAGCIVNILSMSSYGGQPNLTAYSASKGALANFTRNTAHALLGQRIRVNGINTGRMATPNEHKVQRASGMPEDWLQRAELASPFGRLLRPADVAELVAYLLSQRAEMMTGAIIDLDQKVMGAYG